MNLKEIRKKYSFLHVENDEKVLFCTCGKKVIEENNIAKNDEIKIDLKKGYQTDILQRFEKAENIICPKCKTNYNLTESYNKIKKTNVYFYGFYEFKEENERITLYKKVIKASSTLKSRYPKIKEANSYISIDKTSKNIYYKDYKSSKEKEFSLDSVVEIVNLFFNVKNSEYEGLDLIENLIDIHRFINNLASLVVDSKNIDIIDGLMSQMIGKPGINIMSNIITIFLGIICYSNLSTIALTKGSVFLYDMMKNCKLPNVSALSDNNVTSPIKIFNFLVSLENEQIQNNLESEKGENKKFIYKSKGKSININKELLERFGVNKESIKIDMSGGRVNVRGDIKNRTVSKYIFNKIENFKDYQKLIKFTKFISYEDLISLTMKHDIDYLINLFDLIEFRADINSDTLKQIIHLTLNYLEKYKDLNNKSKYKFLQNFSFNNYDDSVRMIIDLKWDRKKEFDKIKKVNELNEYHDKLLEHYNMLSDKEKHQKFLDFTQNFKYLEDYDSEDLKIELVGTPSLLIEYAKDMKNCAGSYVNRVSQGQYLFLMVFDISEEKSTEKLNEFMLGVFVSKLGLEFDQLKGNCNALASNRQKEMVMKFLEDKDISYKELRDLKIIDESKGISFQGNPEML